MQMDDMILVSIDDHSIEPPDMYDHHVPAKWRDQAPKIVRNDAGVDLWVFQGEETSTPFGMAATVGWPREEWGFNPGSFSELRPGCFDVHERVRDMNVNGVLASMCFPTMAGFNARTFTEASDKELSLVMLQAYNDWHIDEWCAAYPGRFIPLGIVPMWDIDLAVKEVKRIAKKGCRAISFLEAPHSQGWPSFLSGLLGPDAAGPRRREHGALPPHRCRVGHHQARARGADRSLDRDPVPGHHAHRAGPAVRSDAAAFPDLKVALSEGGIGWIPFYLDRVDRHFQNQSWIGNSFGEGKLPSDVFREHFLACYITDPSGLKLRNEIGIDVIAWECDYPHTDTTWPESPEFAWKEFQDAGCTDEEIHKITWENALQVLRLGPVRAHAEGAGHRRRPPGAGHGRRHHPHAERGVAQAQRGRRDRRRLR